MAPSPPLDLDGFREITVGRLNTLGAVRREAARLYIAARRGEMASEAASRLASILAIIAKLLTEEGVPRGLPSLIVGLERPGEAFQLPEKPNPE